MILAIGAGGVALAVRPLLGVVVGVVGLGAIWLRGYVVPYTPRFAPRLLSSLPIPGAWFDGRSEPASLADPTALSGETLVERLVERGVVTLDGADLLLDPAFEDRWRAEMRALADEGPESLANAVASDAVAGGADVEPVLVDGRHWLAIDGRHTTIARPVAVAELAALRALEPMIPDESVRRGAAGPLRQFLATCPVCESDLAAASTVACCGGHTDPRSSPAERQVCPDCDAELWRTP